MVVKVSKPEINVREKISELDKPSGTAGQAMLAAETPQEQFQLINAGRRNLIINGAMQVWQRGTSFAAGGGIVYTADRFWRYAGTSGNIERSTDAPTGFAYSWYGNTTGVISAGTTVEIDNNGGRSGYFPQQKYVYSFYLKGDFSNTFLAVGFRNATGTGTDEVPIITFSAGNGNGFGNYSDWTRVEKVIDTTGFTPHANNKTLDLEFGNFPIGGKATGFQFEIGKVATPFEHRSYGEELALCQRYYYQIGDGTAFGSAESGSGGNAYLWAYTFRHPVPMRATPALTLISGGSTYFVGGIGVTIGTPTGDLGTVNTSSMTISTSNVTNVAVHRLGLSGFSFTRGMGYGGTSGFIHCDAEL